MPHVQNLKKLKFTLFFAAGFSLVALTSALLEDPGQSHQSSAVVSADAAEQSPQSCTGKMVRTYGESLNHGKVPIDVTYTDGRYQLRDCQRNIFTMDTQQGTDISHAVDVTSDKPYFDSENARAAVTAHWLAQRFYDYLHENFDRNGYDGQGGPLHQYVHYGENYFNAQFDSGVVIYGDGGAYNSRPIISIDYPAHEISHGITASSAGLIYKSESGALNESFSDIFGKAFHLWMDAQADWNMFSGIYRDPCMSTRSVSAPKTPAVDRSNPLEDIRKACDEGRQLALISQPDTYRGEHWAFGSADSGGVHTNSGPQNYWFYLLAQGGEGINDNGLEYRVRGIGAHKAAQIAYRNLTVYLQAESDFLDARYGSEQAAIDLYGVNSAEYHSVAAAWDAVGVAAQYMDKTPRPAEEFTGFTGQASGDSALWHSAAAGDFPGARIQGDDGTPHWIIHSSSRVSGYNEFKSYQYWEFIAGKVFEWRFVAEPQAAMYADAGGLTGRGEVPFELWNLQDTPEDRSDDVRMIPIVFDVDQDTRFGLISADKSPYSYTLDHPVDNGDNDPWTDMVHWAMPKNTQPGDSGYRAFADGDDTVIADTYLQWIALVDIDGGSETENPRLPAPGSVFRLATDSRLVPPKTHHRPQPVPLAAR